MNNADESCCHSFCTNDFALQHVAFVNIPGCTMKKTLIFALSLISLPVFAEEDQEIGKYVCDIRISSLNIATQILSKAATVLDNGNNFIVQMPNGDQLYSPALESVDDGLKQKAEKGGVTFIRRPTFGDRFIVEDGNTGFFYKLRNCEKE